MIHFNITTGDNINETVRKHKKQQRKGLPNPKSVKQQEHK